MTRWILIASAAFLSAPAAAQTVYGLTNGNRIVTFSPSAPGSLTSDVPINGLPQNTILTGIDIRPLDGALYSVSTAGIVYRLDSVAGGYQAVSTGFVQVAPPLTGTPIPVTGSNFGFDFNPTVDRIRLTSDTDQNLRINPLNGGAASDTPINNGVGVASYDVIGTAYTNSAPGALSTTLYGIDALSSSLLRSTNPNGGVYANTNLAGATFDPLGITLSSQSQVGFDILFLQSINSAFLAANDSFYSVDLTTGRASLIGGIGAPSIRGITLSAVPEPASWAMLLIGFGAIGANMRVRRRVSAIGQVA